MKKTLLLTFILFFLIIGGCKKQQREIAVTIDDLPFIQTSNEAFEHIIQSLVKHKVPATGFVIANRLNNNTTKQLELFRQNGLELGNHTFSHLSLRKVSKEEYIEDLDKADKILAPFMTQPKYFRYPYLAQGRWWTKWAVFHYLNEHHYTVVPVTVDSKDFVFNVELNHLLSQNQNASLADLKKRYLEFVLQKTLKAEYYSKKQILLIHANLLNSYFLDDVLQQFEDRGYHFIPLSEALKST